MIGSNNQKFESMVSDFGILECLGCLIFLFICYFILVYFYFLCCCCAPILFCTFSLADAMESMNSDEFLHFVARYKFTLSFENAVCDDYITEKLWRPLVVGSVPIYMGSPSVRVRVIHSQP
jgi:hypothetical protein